MSKFVRSSKFRHIFGNAAKKEATYDNVKVSRSAWDSNKVKANPKYVSFCWESGGGGAVACIPLEKVGKQPADCPLVRGHKGPVLDMDFNPFNDDILATGSEDTSAAIWVIPEGGLTTSLDKPAVSLNAHRKKVGTIDFHPVANNILATTATDPAVKIWDIEAGKDVFTQADAHTDIIQGLSWNSNGSVACTSSKDKKLRIIDPRQNTVVAETHAHEGVKGFRALFLGKPKELIFSVGFNKSSQRQWSLWDPKELSKPLKSGEIDNAAGLIMPFYDGDNCVMFLAGKGDGNIRYYEVTDEGDMFYFLSEYKSNVAQNGMGSVPKRGLEIEKAEIVRLLKATSTYVEPIQFLVPRKGDQFQDDLYPDTPGATPALSAAEWVGGQTKDPILMKLEPGMARTAGGSFTASVSASDDVSALKARIAELEKQLAEKDEQIKKLQG